MTTTPTAPSSSSPSRWPNAVPVIDAELEASGIRPYSLLGGRSAHSLALRVVDRYRGVVDSTVESQPVRFDAQDWGLEFDEDGFGEAWWIEVQLSKVDDGPVVATLSLSDVETHALIDALLKKISEGRDRFK